MVINFANRIEVARLYLIKLSENLSRPWIELCSEFKAGRTDYVDDLTMIHPEFMRNLKLSSYITHQEIIKKIQGDRIFKKEQGQCQAKVIWGYDCFHNVELCHGDHLFPYSLGGPTLSNNKLLLCKYHNMVKGTDVHLIPWEEHTRFT